MQSSAFSGEFLLDISSWMVTQRGPYPSHGQVGRSCVRVREVFSKQTLQSKVTESALILTRIPTAVSALYMSTVLGGC